MRSFILVILVVSFFRFYQLSSTPPGLYWDELDTGYQSYSLLLTGKDYHGNPLPAHLQSFADYRSSLYMYLTVPAVAFLGLTPAAVRLPAALSSILILPVIYYLARLWLHLPRKIAWVVPAVWGLSPWLMIQGRIAAESALLPLFLMLGFIYLLKFVSSGKYLIIASLCLALTLWTYGTAKVFLPLFLLSVFLTYRSEIKRQWHRNYFLKALLIFCLVSFPVVLETFSGDVSRRFNELSVFTDPVTVSEVNYRRLESSLGSGNTRTPGMQTDLVRRLVFNKYAFWAENIIGNYLSALSSGFLFTSGDPQLRHHLGLANTGQFYAIELFAFVFGLIYLFSFRFSNPKVKLLLILWLIIGPITASLTRDGGNHGPRLLPLLPPLVFIVAYGLSRIARYKYLLALYIPIYLWSLFLAGNWLFSSYRVKASSDFNTGFVPAVSFALEHLSEYDQIVLDGQNESFLMAYLFASGYDPAVFQSSFPLPAGTIANGIDGYQFGQVYILYPGTRDWTKIKLDKKTLVVSVAIQPHVTSIQPDRVFSHPDSSPAVVAFSL